MEEKEVLEETQVEEQAEPGTCLVPCAALHSWTIVGG